MKKTKITAALLSMTLSMTALSGMTMTSYARDPFTEGGWSYDGSCVDGVITVPEISEGKNVAEIVIDQVGEVRIIKIPSTVKELSVTACPELEAFEVAEDNPFICSVDGVVYSKDMKQLIRFPTGKDVTEFTVPDTVEVIGAYAFAGAQISEFILPEGLTEIYMWAFSENTALTHITLPSSLKVAASAFTYCPSLTEIVVLHEDPDEDYLSANGPGPDSDIYSQMLVGCSDVTVYVPDDSYEKYKNDYYELSTGIGGSWNKDGNKLLPYSEYLKEHPSDVSDVTGDANCDGTMDMSDAVLIMQSIANPDKYKLTEQGSKNADMDGDGVTNGDALAIQKKLLRLE